jgi:uncharacterized protein (TIGR04562 family)
MERPSYLSKYLFDWELIEAMLNGRSAIDSKFFVSQVNNVEQANSFLRGYGLDPNDLVSKSELFGNFQEALQFIRRYFLKEGNEDGLDLKMPSHIYRITDINELFFMATQGGKTLDEIENKLWAEVILKVMHTILHVDKDLRSNYFSEIQKQVFDRFYKYIFREKEKLFLGIKGIEGSVPLIDFETKSKKTRDSVIIKLLHKAENVAEELFDTIGIRFITETRFDTIRVVKFLIENTIVIPHNIKPSRSVNTLVDLGSLKKKHKNLIKMALRNKLSEERFVQAMERECIDCSIVNQKISERNMHSSKNYQAVQFTGRHLINYKNPFLQDFNEVRKLAKDLGEDQNDLSKKVLSLDISLIARDIRFFYPYEVQVVDKDCNKSNTEGEASHLEYKRSQQISSMKRVFAPLIKFKNIN